MSLNHSPKITTDNLLLNLDFKNPKKFTNSFGNNNLVQDWKYNATTWRNVFPTYATLTTGIDAPDGTKTAVRFSCKTTGQSLLRIDFNSFTPNGTDTYIVSFWVRLKSGTTSEGNLFYSDLHDAGSFDYKSLLVVDKWINVRYSLVPTATAKTFVDLLSNNTNDYVLDFWGVKVEKAEDTVASIPFEDTIGNAIFNTYRPNYYTLDQDYIKFDRSATAPKTGGYAYGTMTGNLTAANFLYNNHTWEIWFMIDDRTPTNLPTYEGNSTIAAYSGYHAGFLHDSSTLIYLLWNGTTNSVNAAYWSLGNSGAQINQGQWHQVVVVNLNGTFIPYVNGVQLGVGSTPTISATGIGVSNNLMLGAAQNVAAGTGNYCYYSKNKIANMKMYNRALSANEIKQNFNALRGRFGL